MGKRIVIALGGNALGNTPYEQLALVTETAKPIVDLIAQGNEVIIAHGNGPQVGMINLGMATAAEAKAIKSDMPFPECGAMSQGYIGYHLQNAIGNELASRGMAKDVATVVTQVLVDEADPAFQHPTKPVGAFYDKETADRIAAEKGYTMVEDAGRGYRQVVPSPKPIDVIEKNTVKALVDNGTVVITVGGAPCCPRCRPLCPSPSPSPAASPSSPCSRRPPTASPARPAPASTSKSGSDKSPNVPYNLYKRFARKGKPFVCFFSPFSAFSPLSLKIFQQLWLCFQFFFSFARCVLLENFV